jgi:polyisoprenoid-binding protein YceI
MGEFKKGLMTLSSVACALAAHAEQDIYRIDNTHSFANWTIRHVVSKTSGTFSDVTGKIRINTSNLADSSVDARINMLSLNSNHAMRDAHIKKEEYLDFAKSTEMTFVSSKIEASSNTEGVIYGTLTLHSVSKDMSFPFKVLGFGFDPWGGYRMGIEAHTSIKASDFAFKWPLKPDPPVGDEVEITLLVEGVKQPREILK